MAGKLAQPGFPYCWIELPFNAVGRLIACALGEIEGHGMMFLAAFLGKSFRRLKKCKAVQLSSGDIL